ncbi:MAG TPA: LPS export ABC transporter periplasmic protein LptC [Bdellovibrionota bacterium]|jgi:LPS export ABC transporter protein LptC
MRAFRGLLRFLSYGLLFLTIWFLWPRELDGYSVGRDGRTAVPDYSMVNAHYISVKAGRVEAETFAHDAAFNMTTHRMDAKTVVALIYNEAEQRTVVRADHANFLMDDRILHLTDNVHTLSPDGFLMKGPEATYNMGKRLLTASQPIEGETFMKEVQIWGDSAEAPMNENKVYLKGNARALYQERRHGATRIKGETAVMDRAQQKVTFEKNVKVEQEKTVGTSQAADLFYSKEDKGVRYMSLNTDVKIAEADGKYTRSQVAEFFAPTDTIVLSGFPAVYDGDDAVTGDKITVYRATGVVEVMATNAAGAQERAKGGKKGSETPTLTKEDEELIPE